MPGPPGAVPGPSAYATSEYLDSGHGLPMPPGSAVLPRRSRKGLWIGGGVVGLLALAGAGTWAFVALSGGGPQPSEALPASTLAYASIDLDPSAGQKVEAIKMLKKFPSIDDQLGLNAQDDLRKALFDAIQKDAKCDNLDYEDDFGWLGNRAAVAAVDTGGETPSPVLVLASTDSKAAEAGLRSLAHCVSTGNADEAGDVAAHLGWKVTEDWAVIAETDDIAAAVVKDSSESSLADDKDYQRWMDELGDPGIMTMYAAPEVGKALADWSSQLADGGVDTGAADAVQKQLDQFRGMAGTVRFHDGSLQFEYAAATAKLPLGLSGQGGDDMVATLPTDTAAVIGLGFQNGWAKDWLDQIVGLAGDQSDVDQVMSELESQTGLSLPEDLETLFGDSAALVLGGDVDAANLEQADPSEVPVALKVHGDPAAVQAVLDKLTAQMPPDEATILGTSVDGDVIVIGPNADYRDALLGKGSLGGSQPYRAVITESDKASMVFYVDFDVNDWLVEVAGDDQELVDNLEPLSSVGMSAWLDGDVAHAQFQLSTD